MNHKSSFKHRNTNIADSFFFSVLAAVASNKPRSGSPGPVSQFLSDPKISRADVKNRWAPPPAAGDHARVGDDIRDLEGASVSEYSRCGGVGGSTEQHRDRI